MKVNAIFLICLLAMTTAAIDQTSNVFMPGSLNELEEIGYREAVLIAGGILKGAFKYESSIVQCFDDSMKVFEDFKNSFNCLNLGTFKGIEDGLIHIGMGLLKLPRAMQDCKGLEKDIEKIKELSEKFQNPSQLAVSVGKNIFWHGISIYREINTGIASYKHEEWFSFGMSVGIIMDLVFLKSQQQIEEVSHEGSDFLKGFAKGFSPSTHEYIRECLDKASPAYIERVTTDLSFIIIKNMDESLSAIQDTAEVFLGAVIACKSIRLDALSLIHILFGALNSNVFIDKAKTIPNIPNKLADLVDKTQHDFKNLNFFGAGEDLGTFVGEVLGTNITPSDSFVKQML